MTERDGGLVGGGASASPPGRSCGDCALCCTVLRVDALRKLGGTPCGFLREDASGCGIYADRPAICRAYRCLWLQGGLEEQDRPDRLGAVLDVVNEAGTTRLSVREARPGALERNPRLREIVARYREALPVRVSDIRDVMNPDAPFRVLLPGDEEHRVSGDTRTLLRGGREIEVRRLPWLERLVRRIVNRVRAWRVRDYGNGRL